MSQSVFVTQIQLFTYEAKNRAEHSEAWLAHLILALRCDIRSAVRFYKEPGVGQWCLRETKENLFVFYQTQP